MRRSLVLTNEAARHPFRAALPPSKPLPVPRRRARQPALDAVREFLLAFCAFFLAALAFII